MPTETNRTQTGCFSQLCEIHSKAIENEAETGKLQSPNSPVYFLYSLRRAAGKGCLLSVPFISSYTGEGSITHSLHGHAAPSRGGLHIAHPSTMTRGLNECPPIGPYPLQHSTLKPTACNVLGKTTSHCKNPLCNIPHEELKSLCPGLME